MGIGRERFSQLFGESAAALPAEPSSHVLNRGDHYVNFEVGLAFRKPREWHFANPADFQDVALGSEENAPTSDPEDADADNGERAILAIKLAKYPSPPSEFTPQIDFLTRHRHTLAKLVQAMQHLAATVPSVGNAGDELRYLSTIFPSLKVLLPVSEVRISECEAAEYRAAFEIDHEKLTRPVRVRLRALRIIQLPYWHSVYMLDSPYLGLDCTAEFDLFANSIYIL
jgi:hypothetical protein